MIKVTVTVDYDGLEIVYTVPNVKEVDLLVEREEMDYWSAVSPRIEKMTFSMVPLLNEAGHAYTVRSPLAQGDVS